MRTLVHVTHEAVYQAGGIGTVLRGLITASAYQEQVHRTVLIGPLGTVPSEPFGSDGTVLYDTHVGIQTVDLAALLSPIEAEYGTRLVYGHRQLNHEAYSQLLEILEQPNHLDLLNLFFHSQYYYQLSLYLQEKCSLLN